MTTIRQWVVELTVLICACLMPAAPLSAQTPQEWASAGALGDVFVGTQTATLFPQIKIFGHGCASPPPAACVGVVKEDAITVGSKTGTIRAFAFDTTPKDSAGKSQYDLYVAVDTGEIWRIKGTPVGGSRPAQLVVDTSSQDIRQIKFDEDRNLYVSYGGMSPKIEKRTPPNYTSVSVTHPVQCDVSPAPGLWFDLTARTLTAKQFALYACGTRQIRSVDVSSTPTTSSPFATLPNLPGNTETGRDLILLAPTAALGDPTKVNTVYEVQGGLVVAYGTNLQWLDRFGAVIGSFDFGSGSAAVDTWTNVAVSPTGGSVWGAAADTSFLTRFRLSSSFSAQPEVRFDTSSVPVTALIVNGQPNLASAMQLITVNGPTGTYLKGTRWEHSVKFEAFKAPPDDDVLDPQYSSVRMAVTSFEGQTAGSFTHYTDLNLDGRLTLFSGARAFNTSRGRGNYYRMIQQSSENVSTVDMRVTISYIHEEFTQPVAFLTGLYDDLNHSARGFLTDSGQVNQFDKNIRDEWFKTDSTARGSTRTSNDYMIGVQTGTTATLDSFKTSVTLGASMPIRATYSFAVTPTFCAGLVLTAARDGAPFVIVGSSLTTLSHLGEGIPFFTPAGTTAPNTCRANLDVEPNSNEQPSPPGGPDFAVGRKYNICVVFKDLETLPANTTPPADVCGTTLVK